MKRLTRNVMLVIPATLATTLAIPAFASHPDANYDWAKVVDARPIIESVRRPVQEEVCWDEAVWRRDPPRRSVAPVILAAALISNCSTPRCW